MFFFFIAWIGLLASSQSPQHVPHIYMRRFFCFYRVERPCSVSSIAPTVFPHISVRFLFFLSLLGMTAAQVRSKTPAEAAEEEELLKKEADKMAEAGDGGEEDTFLRDFVANRRWLDPNAKETPR